MAKLSKESENRITSALEKAAELIDNGTHPNDALIKVAKSSGIPAGHVHLMVNAVNIGRTNSQRLNHESLSEKLASFPLADTQTILDAVFPSKVETKNANYQTTAVSADYTTRPRWFDRKIEREKTASASLKLSDKEPVIARYETCPVETALNTLQKMSNVVEEKRRNLTAVRNRAIKLAEDLNDYFLTPNHIPLKEVKENCTLLFGKHAEVVLDNNIKEASTTTKTRTPVNMKQEPYATVKELIYLAHDFNEKNAELKAAANNAHEEATKLLRPFGPSEAQGRSVLDIQSCKEASEKDATIGALVSNGLGVINAMNIAKNLAGKVPGLPNDSNSQRESDIQELMDPGHESEIRNIQSESLLNDLMANDEIISGHNPEDVIDAFNEVSQIAPFAANKKAIMRDLLRKRLSGGAQALDQFTVGDALKTQQSLQDMYLPKKENLSVLSSMGAFGHAKPPEKPLGE
jgi:hypothetical protein